MTFSEPAMELPVVRRRTPKPHKLEEEQTILIPPQRRSCPQFLIMVVVLILLNIWCSFLFINSFHFCVSSFKMDLYCIYGGTGSRFTIARHPITDLAGQQHRKEGVIDPAKAAAQLHLQEPDREQQVHIQDENQGSGNGGTGVRLVQNNQLRSSGGGGGMSVLEERLRAEEQEREEAEARKVAVEQIQILRSWTVPKDSARGSCDGKGIFVYDLPSRFNKDILAQCDDLIPWKDLCKHFSNDAMGPPVPELGKAWYGTHQYSLEPIFHSRVLNHPCRVQDPAAAKLFYVPFYGGLNVLKWHFKNVSSDVKDALGMELVRWLEAQPPWRRSAGKDHMFVLGKISWDFRRYDSAMWGSNFLLLDQMKNPYKFLIERQPWEINEIGVPHPTFFHPHGDADIDEWQSRMLSSNRNHLVGFAGAPRDEASESIRSQLITQCTSHGNYCRFLDCSTGSCSRPEAVVAVFRESEFCLQPPGDSPTRKSVFDSLVAGCIPVFFNPFTAYLQYPWHLPEEKEKYSVFIDEGEVRQGKVDIIERLKSFTSEQREEMRRYIALELMPGLVYGDSTSMFEKYRDAYQVVMDNMINKVTTLSE